MPNVVIVFHSGYGHTAKQAEAVREGAVKGGADVLFLTAAEAVQQWEALARADAIIFGAPTYMGSLSAEFKKFMEASAKPWYTQDWKDKLAAGFTNSSSLNGDKYNSLAQLAGFAAQHGMLWVSLGLLPANNSKSQRNDLNRMGSFLGAMSQSDSDVGPDVAPPAGDLDTARHLGERVARLAAKHTGR